MSISELKSLFLADAMAFPTDGRGGPIVVEKGLKSNLMHVTAVPPWIPTMKKSLEEIERFKKMIQEQPRLKLVTNQKELSVAVADKKVAVVLGMQNTPTDIMNGGAIKALREAKIGIIAPCYGRRNLLGSGWLNADLGLTEEGKFFLKECGENGIIVDLSHSGQKMKRDIISEMKKRLDFNLMISHTGCYSKRHHIYNTPDDILIDVARLGGIVGISTLTFINHEDDNSVFPFKDHLIQAISLCGEDSVCVGSDDLYVTRNIEESRKQFDIISEKLDPDKTMGARFPENPLEIMGPDMLEKLYKFCLPYFPTKTVENVFGQNLFNFFARALPAE